MTPKQELFLRSLELAVQIKGPVSRPKMGGKDVPFYGTPKSDLDDYLPLAAVIQETVENIKD